MQSFAGDRINQYVFQFKISLGLLVARANDIDNKINMGPKVGGGGGGCNLLCSLHPAFLAFSTA